MSTARRRVEKSCRLFFFFSSRRRHTRFDCDWSSDVCSSDLAASRVELLATQTPGHFMAFDLLALDEDRKSTRLNSSHSQISYAVFCLKKKNNQGQDDDRHCRNTAHMGRASSGRAARPRAGID